MRPVGPTSARPKLSEPDCLSGLPRSRVVLSLKLPLLLEIDPYAGPTFLDILPDVLPLWKNLWLILPKTLLLPIERVDLSMLGIEARGTDCVVRTDEELAWLGDANRGLWLLGAARLAAGADSLRPVLATSTAWMNTAKQQAAQTACAHFSLDTFIIGLATPSYCSKATIRCQTTKISKINP
jgi:hypothetical protein